MTALILGVANALLADAAIEVNVETDPNAGVGFGHLTVGGHDLDMKLKTASKTIDRSEVQDDAGTTLWQPRSNETDAQEHDYEARGIRQDDAHAVRFEGKLKANGGGGGGGGPATFNVAVNDIDVDVDSDNDSAAEDRPPSRSDDEDDVEMSDGGQNQAMGLNLAVGGTRAKVVVSANVRKAGVFRLGLDVTSSGVRLLDSEGDPLFSIGEPSEHPPGTMTTYYEESVEPGEKSWTFFVESDGASSGDVAVILGVIDSDDDRVAYDECQVNAVATTVDLIVADVDDGDEDNPGAFVCLNDDFDEGNQNGSGEDVADNQPNGADHRITAADDELLDGKIVVEAPAGTTGKWKLEVTGTSTFVWYEDDSGVWNHVESEHESDTVTIPSDGKLEIDLKFEGVTESESIRDVTVTASFTLTGASAAVDDDTGKLTAYRLLLAAQDILEKDKVKRGAVLCLNDDNDDFTAPNYAVDHTQNAVAGVPGEDDLKTIDLHLSDVMTTGEVRLTLSAGAANVRVWEKGTKETIVLGMGNNEKKWTIAQFRALSLPFYVEGAVRSGTVKESEIKLAYYADASDADAACEDPVKYTVVDLVLDVDRDGANTDDNLNYKPGYTGIAGPAAGVTAIAPPGAAWTFQQMQLLCSPAELGGADTDIGDQVVFRIVDTTSIPGVATNFGAQTGGDFSFANGTNTDLLAYVVNENAAKQAVHDIYCKDFGGQCRAVAEIHRGSTVLATCEIRIPLDTDRDWLPDFYETANTNNPAGVAVLAVNNPNTGGVAGQNDRFYDLDATPAAAGNAGNAANPITRNGPTGATGDGLTAFEEYRGIWHRNAANGAPAHDRTSPHVKHLFMATNIFDAGADMQLGNYPGAVPGGMLTHRVTHAPAAGLQEFDATSRVLNFNQPGTYEGGSPYPIGWFKIQRILQMRNAAIGGNTLGQASGPQVHSGSNGVCETFAQPGPGGGVPPDVQVIPLWQGRANAVAITPGLNGIIDPPTSGDDVVDADVMRIQPGPDGKLDTLNPLVDDVVRGKVVGSDGTLDHATVTGMIAADHLLGTIEEGADAKIEQATVTTNPGDDDHSGLKIVPNGDGLQTPVNAADVLVNGEIVPGADNKLDSAAALAGNDTIRGAIAAGANGRLDSRPTNANDVVKGHIGEGGDGVLQSRPGEGTNDFVDGWVGPGLNGVFNPRVNDDRTTNLNPGDVPAGQRANDDMFDPITMTIHTGVDGLRSTTKSGDDDFVMDIGNGSPFETAITNTSIIIAAPNTNAMGVASREGADDNYTGAIGGVGGGGGVAATLNQSPNEHGLITIDVAFFQTINTFLRGPDGQPGTADDIGPDGVFPSADDLRVDLRTPANGGVAGNAANRQAWIRKTMTHEGGHGIGMEHYRRDNVGPAPGRWDWNYTGQGVPFPNRQASGVVPWVGAGAWTLGVPANTDYMRSGIWAVAAPAGVFDPVSADQIRLHLKHP